jgi:hypothetical protein
MELDPPFILTSYVYEKAEFGILKEGKQSHFFFTYSSKGIKCFSTRFSSPREQAAFDIDSNVRLA